MIPLGTHNEILLGPEDEEENLYQKGKGFSLKPISFYI